MTPAAPDARGGRDLSAADLSACATEPIHIPGAIQPHGCLLVADAGGVVLQASANAQQFLGLAQPPLGQPLPAVLGPMADRIAHLLLEIEESGDAIDSQQVQLALRRLAASAQLQKAAVKAREDLVAVVSHDLRTPISIVAMQAVLLQRLANQEVEERAGRLLASVQTIQRSAERMTSLLRDLLDLGKIEAGRFEVVPGPQPAELLVAESCELMQHVGGAKGVNIVQAAAPPVLVRADAERVFQVFANLVGNAVKFTPEGGTVTVGSTPVAGGCEFFVRDTGMGMSAEQLEHVFERYWQGRPATSSGAGLGLYICKGIVEAHGGRMRAESVPGAGSAFYFTLPAA